MYPFASSWAFGLFPPLACYESSAAPDVPAQVLCGPRFSFLLGVRPGAELWGHVWSSIDLSPEPPCAFPKQWPRSLPPAVSEPPVLIPAGVPAPLTGKQ